MKLHALLLVVSLIVGSPTLSQTTPTRLTDVDDEFLSPLTYRFAGPYRGGRVTAVAGIPEQPYTFLMGSTGGGVWKSNDAGNSWSNISDGQIECGSIGAISIAPSNYSIIYVGTGSDSPRGNVSPGIGMYKSLDGGDTWHYLGLEKAGQIGDILIHPTNPDLLYVAVLGNLFGPDPNRGVYRSADGGNNWEKILFLSDSTGAVDLAMHPSNPNTIWAGMWRVERKPWTLIDGSTEGGLYKSSDAGQNWTRIFNGLPGGLVGRIGVDISLTNPRRIWVIQQAALEEDGGVYRSDDNGKTFIRVNRDHKLRQRGWYYSRIFAHPTDENTVYVTNTGFYRSIDAGKNFDHQFAVPHADNHDVWINPINPEIMIGSNDGGATVTLNGGATWSSLDNQPTAELYRVHTDNQFPFRLYGAQQDNTTISLPSRSSGGIHPKQVWNSVGGGESGYVAVRTDDPNIVYAGSYSGILTRVDLATDEETFVGAYPHYTEGTEQRNLKYRWQWNFPIIISRHDPDVIYQASNYVHRSTNQGQTWEVISPDLTSSIDAYHGIPGGPIQHDATGVEIFSSIFALKESLTNPLVLWAGSDDGLIHLTQDGGRSWRNITPSGMPPLGTVNDIEISPHKEGEAYAVVYRYRRNDLQPYVFHTTNYGESWSLKSTKGISPNHFARCIAVDPVRKGLLYLGTEYGMYVSFDDGSQWTRFQSNLPHTPITDLEIRQGSLAMSTQGRGFWIFDDIDIIRQITDDVLASNLYLFTPKNAYRSNTDGFSYKSAPEKAPYDAVITFLLGPVLPESMTLRIMDSDRETVRYWSSVEDSAYFKLEPQPGLNQLEWNLEYPPPRMVPDLVMMDMSYPGTGPLAPPGDYFVQLITDRDTLEGNFKVVKDPRWTVTDHELRLSFELARQIGNLLEKSQNQILSLRSYSKQLRAIADRAQRAGYDSIISVRARELNLELEGLQDLIFQSQIESSQDEINYPRRFTNHLIRLYALVIAQQHRPTGGELERWSDLLDEYGPFNQGYQSIIENDIPSFERLLKEHRVPFLIPDTPE